MKAERHVSFLVRPHEDMMAQQKKQLLQHHFNIEGIRKLSHGVLWSVISNESSDDLAEQVINSFILYNPHAHDCYYY
jgi:phosphoribosylformylglycinamidine synthase